MSKRLALFERDPSTLSSGELKIVRKIAGFKIPHAAEMLGVRPVDVIRWEEGRARPTDEQFRRIGKLYHAGACQKIPLDIESRDKPTRHGLKCSKGCKKGGIIHLTEFAYEYALTQDGWDWKCPRCGSPATYSKQENP